MRRKDKKKINVNISALIDVIHENKIIAMVFLFSVLFFAWQRSTGFSWDFSGYVLNAQYISGDGYYFEWVRQPLPSLIILLLSFLGWAAAEYAYIIFVSLLHLFSSIKFAEKLGVDKTLFYVFSMNAYVLIFGLKIGSELLSLALLQLFIAYLYEKKSGVFAGLFLLARYSNLNFLLLILAQRNVKKIIVFIFLILLVISPWLYFNYAKTGDPFTSIRDFYLLNVVFRQIDNYVNDFSFFDFFLALNLLIPLMLLGLSAKRNEKYYLMMVFFAISVVSYVIIPFKEERFLFPITLPAAYFAARGMKKIKNKEKYIFAFVLASLLLLFLLLPAARNEPSYFYRTVKSDCMVQSNVWIALNYYGIPSEPHPNQEDFAASIEQGYRIILFKSAEFPIYLRNETFLAEQPVIEENEGYAMFGDALKCKQPERYEMFFLDRIKGKIESGDVECSFLSCRYLK